MTRTVPYTINQTIWVQTQSTALFRRASSIYSAVVVGAALPPSPSSFPSLSVAVAAAAGAPPKSSRSGAERSRGGGREGGGGRFGLEDRVMAKSASAVTTIVSLSSMAEQRRVCVWAL